MPSFQARTTIYDVASRAGVAISTVSRVLNNSSEVADATRTRVLETIEELNYRPQRTAQDLARGGGRMLAVAMPSFTSLFFVEILKGVKDVLKDHGSDLMLCNLGSQEPQATLARFLERGAVAGLIVTSLDPDDEIRRSLVKMQAPVVLIGARDEAFDSIWWDDVAGSRRATEHLISLGHLRIGMIAAHEWSQAHAPRLQGYREALAASGIEYDESLVVRGDTDKHAGFSEEAGAEAMRKLLDLETPPTAVFAASDVQAYGAWSHARSQGLEIPRDLSLMGYDDLKLSHFLGLSSIDQHMHLVGTLAAERLLARMDEVSAPPVDADDRLDTEIETVVIARASTASVA
ncbi:MAG: LacI family DNA-binding transcriptional regulator [Bacteroidota bacterium]